jgi:hypothetical protein
MVFDAHDRAFRFFRGACSRGIYDNMKTAVDTVFLGKDRQFNRRFLQMCGHYLVEPESERLSPTERSSCRGATSAHSACTPAAGWEKGQVENQSLPPRRRGWAWCVNASLRRGFE